MPVVAPARLRLSRQWSVARATPDEASQKVLETSVVAGRVERVLLELPLSLFPGISVDYGGRREWKPLLPGTGLEAGLEVFPIGHWLPVALRHSFLALVLVAPTRVDPIGHESAYSAAMPDGTTAWRGNTLGCKTQGDAPDTYGLFQ